MVAALAFLALAVVTFTGGWSGGHLILDGPGSSLWVSLLLDHWRAGHGIPAWIPEMWAGTPASGLFAFLPMLVLMPIAEVLGPEEAVKVATVAAQVVAAWGAFVLALSLWDKAWPALAAGFLYGLHPLFASHGALFGQEPIVWVFTATPWLLWSLRLALKRQGPQYVAIAGVVVALAVVQQAEYAYGLMLLCVLLLVVQLCRARHTGVGPTGPGGVVFRAGTVVAIGLGALAYWLLPFVAMSKSFVLTPRDEVRAVLEYLSGAVSREPGTFLDRATRLTGTFDFVQLDPAGWKGAISSSYYMGSVAVTLAALTVMWLARRHRDDDGTLSAILLASIAGMWLSMGPVSLASGGLASRSRVLSLAIIGITAGMLVGNFLRRLELGRAALPASVAAALFLFAVPYLTPLVSLQGVVPFLSSIRVHRLYNLAALGVSLGAAYPLTLVQRWAATRRPQLAPLLGASLCFALLGAFVVDVSPYRSYYRLRPPDDTAILGQASRVVAAGQQASRISTEYFGSPRPVATLLDAGGQLSVGWPHPLASKKVWRLTAEVMAGYSPTGYRDAALGLSSTSHLALTEGLSSPDDQFSGAQNVNLEPNPKALPLVRAYEQVVVVEDGDVTPELAVALSGRYVGVVRGGTEAARAVGGATIGFVDSPDPCSGPTDRANDVVAAEIAMACGMHNWVGLRLGRGDVGIKSGVGGAVHSPLSGLRGVAVWLDRVPGLTELVLLELRAGGTELGRVVARTTATDIDDNGMARFLFDPIAESAGRSYAFLLSCPRCPPGDDPRMVVTSHPRGPANLVIGGQVEDRRAAAFSPLYEPMPPAAPPETALAASRPGPGRWRIEVSGHRPVLVVVAESHFPGWTAKVDGRPVEVLEADGAFLGVPVSAGHHDVTLEYRRSSANLLGRIVTGGTLLFCLILVLAHRARSRRMNARARRDTRGSLRGTGRPVD